MSYGPNQQKFIEALRSGDYHQTQFFLEDDRRYDALGVACRALESPTILVNRHGRTGPLVGQSLDDQPSVAFALALRNTVGTPSIDESNITWEGVKLVNEVCRALHVHSATWNDRRRAVVNYPCRVKQCGLVTLNDYYQLPFHVIAAIIEQFPTLYFSQVK
jgi:hypothetical protein